MRANGLVLGPWNCGVSSETLFAGCNDFSLHHLPVAFGIYLQRRSYVDGRAAIAVTLPIRFAFDRQRVGRVCHQTLNTSNRDFMLDGGR